MIYETKNKRIISVIFLLLFTVSVFTPQASAAYYEDTFPYDETGLTGGAYIECSSSLGDIVLVLPMQYIDRYFTFTTSGNLFNASSSTITVALYLNGTQYSARFPSFSTLEYRVSTSGYYDYTAVTTGDIYDTNVIFVTSSERINDNYYFTKFEIATLSVQIATLFFVFLGWFLLHKQY